MVTTGARGSQVLVGVGLADEAFLDVGLRHALGRVAELAHDQLGRVGVDDVVDLVHRALPHQQLDDVDGALRHAVGELLDGDHLGDDHLAHDLVARLHDAGLAQLLALAPAAQRGERALALRLVEGVVDGELDALAALLAGLDGALGGLGALLLGARFLLGSRARSRARAPPALGDLRLDAPRRLRRSWPSRRGAACPRSRGDGAGAGSARPRLGCDGGSSPARRLGRSAAAAPRGARARPPRPRRAPSPASSARRRASSSSVDRPPGRCMTSASSRSASAPASFVASSTSAAGAGDRALLLLLDDHRFERPWLKLCLTWPESTVRFRLSGLRGRHAASSRWFLSSRSCTSCVWFLRPAAARTAQACAQPVTPKAPASCTIRWLAPPSDAAACTTFGRPMAKLNSAPVNSRTMACRRPLLRPIKALNLRSSFATPSAAASAAWSSTAARPRSISSSTLAKPATSSPALLARLSASRQPLGHQPLDQVGQVGGHRDLLLQAPGEDLAAHRRGHGARGCIDPDAAARQAARQVRHDRAVGPSTKRMSSSGGFCARETAHRRSGPSAAASLLARASCVLRPSPVLSAPAP